MPSQADDQRGVGQEQELRAGATQPEPARVTGEQRLGDPEVDLVRHVVQSVAEDGGLLEDERVHAPRESRTTGATDTSAATGPSSRGEWRPDGPRPPVTVLAAPRARWLLRSAVPRRTRGGVTAEWAARWGPAAPARSSRRAASPSSTPPSWSRRTGVLARTAGRCSSREIGSSRWARTGRSRFPRRPRRSTSPGGRSLPGLVDSHVHARSAELARYVDEGITTVRNMWGCAGSARGAPRPWCGTARWPRPSSPPRPVSTAPARPWPYTQLITDPAAADALVARLAGEGWRWVKVYSHLDAPVFEALADAADARGIRLLGHVPFAVPLQRALDRRMLSIEHLTGYELALGGLGETPAERWASVVLAEMPALAAGDRACRHLELPDHDGGEGADGRGSGRSRGEPPPAPAGGSAAMPRAPGSSPERTRASTPPWPGSSLHDELEELVASGLNPLEALQAATSSAGRVPGQGGGDRHGGSRLPRGPGTRARGPAAGRGRAPSPAGGAAPRGVARAALRDRHSRTGAASAARPPVRAPGASRAMASAPAAAMAHHQQDLTGLGAADEVHHGDGQAAPEHPAGVDGAGDGAALFPADPGLRRDDAGARRGAEADAQEPERGVEPAVRRAVGEGEAEERRARPGDAGSRDPPRRGALPGAGASPRRSCPAPSR